jgi:hypothetical protein
VISVAREDIPVGDDTEQRLQFPPGPQNEGRRSKTAQGLGESPAELQGNPPQERRP